jgi:hypothetical protein
MDWQSAFNIAFSLLGVALGWGVNNITRSINTLDRDVRNLPQTYVQKDQYRSDINDIKRMLNKIFDRLDEKADKP